MDSKGAECLGLFVMNTRQLYLYIFFGVGYDKALEFQGKW